MQEEGFVAKLLYPDGAKDVKLGAPLCILAYSEKDIPALADWTPAGSTSAAPQAV
jgi:pyruvate dehydrogenase E2 component (dihydrolipoamide acetyltransferase)